MSPSRVTPDQVRQWPPGQPLLAMTAYDTIFARLADEGGADLLHVGDTLAITALGFNSTSAATMADMVHHTSAVARGRQRALITADLPAGSYDFPAQAVENAQRLIEAGADAVKLEGGLSARSQIEAIRAAGIELQGHIGLLPQFAREPQDFRRKGRTTNEAKALLADALFLAQAGAFSIVLENVLASVAADITQAISIPTLGIASGPHTTGQIVVTPEILGLKDWQVPPFVQPVTQLGQEIRRAVAKLRTASRPPAA